MRVIYRVEPDDLEASGLIAKLAQERPLRETLTAVQLEYVGLYRLQPDGFTLVEVIAKSKDSRDGGACWRHARTTGPRQLSDEQFSELTLRAAQTWHRDWKWTAYREGYRNTSLINIPELMRLVSDDETPFRDALRTVEADAKAKDLIDDRYANSSPYLDRVGRPVPREHVVALRYTFAARTKWYKVTKVFVFDRRTGDVLEDPPARPRQ
jgi:hypothetical protein